MPIEIGSETLGNEIWAALVERLPLPVLAFDPAGQLRYCNGSARELAVKYGCARGTDLLPAAYHSPLEACARGAEAGTLESPLGDRIFAWSFFPLREKGWGACLGADVTVQGDLQRQLHAIQKSLLVGSLQPSVARDLSNVLTVIQGQASLLRNASEVSPAIADSLRSIAVAAQGACRLINQVNSLGREDPKLGLVDLNGLLTRLSPLLSRVLREDVTVEFHYAADLPRVEADAAELEQIVLILASNARDAMPQGGSLSWQTASVELDRDPALNGGHRAGSYVCVSCSDTGCGMDAAVQARLFEGLFTTKKDGNGLGLFVAQQIARKYRGWIEVQSRLGEGTTFKLWIPAVSDTPIAEAGAHRWLGTEAVLVVEDEPAVRLTIKNILERYGYQVFEAATSVEALAVWHRHHAQIRLLLTDLVLPSGLTGEELSERFRSHKSDLGIIYISGYSREVATRDGSAVAGVAFLEKPFEADRLIQLVRESLDAVKQE